MDIFEFFNIEVVGSPRAHSPYEAEQQMFGLIRDGDTAAVMRLVSSLGTSQMKPIRVGKMSDNELRQAQYLAISLVTLGTRYAIEGGMRETDAYHTSDVFVQRIDRERRVENIFKLCTEIMMQLAEAVHRAKPARRYTPPIKKCMDYIDANLEGRILLETLSELCALSPVYLSTLFKKETGVNLSEYILDRKLDCACGLIRDGRLSFDEIAAQLGFCSQSYFIRCFKKVYGVTPREFRQSGE